MQCAIMGENVGGMMVRSDGGWRKMRWERVVRTVERASKGMIAQLAMAILKACKGLYSARGALFIFVYGDTFTRVPTAPDHAPDPRWAEDQDQAILARILKDPRLREMYVYFSESLYNFSL
jgi:hypothetical protein